jgi:Fibronectin type III-like domain
MGIHRFDRHPYEIFCILACLKQISLPILTAFGAAGESKPVSIAVHRDRLTIFDEAADGWKLVPGSYKVLVGGSSRDLPLTAAVSLE